MKPKIIITPELMKTMVESLKTSQVYKDKLERARQSVMNDKVMLDKIKLGFQYDQTEEKIIITSQQFPRKTPAILRRQNQAFGRKDCLVEEAVGI